MTIRITLLVLVTGLFAMIWTHDQPAPNACRGRQALVKPIEVKAPEIGHLGAATNEDPSPPALPRWIVKKLASARQTLKSDWLPVIARRTETALEKSSQSIAAAGREWALDQFAKSSHEIHGWVTAKIGRPAPPAEIAAKAEGFCDSEMPLPAGIVPGEYRAVSNTGTVRRLMLMLEELPADSEFVTRDVYQSSGETSRWFFIRVQSDPSESVPVIADRPAAAPQ